VAVVTIAPTVSIELATGIGAIGESFLTLNEPVKGQLDDASYPLFNPVGPDITTDIAAGAFEYSIRRGRTNELDVPSTGTCAVNLRNHTAIYQFDGVDGYDAGRRIRVTLDGVTVFDGIVDDWLYDYPVDGGSTARVVAVDVMGKLANQTFDEWTTAAGQTPGQRVTSVLDRSEVAFPASLRSIDTSSSAPYAADLATWGSNVLNYLHAVARSDDSIVFASRDGQLVFQRRRNVTFTIDAVFADTGSPASDWSLDDWSLDDWSLDEWMPDGTGIPIVNVRPVSGSEFYYTRVTGKRENGTQQTVSIPGAPVMRTLTIPDLLLASDSDVLHLLERYLDRYRAPRTRIRSLSVNLSGLTPDQRVKVLALDIGNVAALTWTPEGASSPVAFTGYIESISISGSARASAVMTFELSPATYIPPPAFTLDDVDHGVLDDDVLYF